MYIKQNNNFQNVIVQPNYYWVFKTFNSEH